MNRRWLVLLVGLLALIAGCAYQYGLPYLIPALRADKGLSLRQAAIVISCPVAGLLVALAPWGMAADRWGERIILSTGLTIAGVALLVAAAVDHTAALAACFLLAGAGGASIHAASGRLILGWFAAHERGLAAGAGLTALACCCLTAALLVALLVRDPAHAETPGQQRAGSPYRTPVLWRIHAASALLVVPQFAVSAFALVYLVDERGWDGATAGRVLAVAQVGGAAARLAAGHWSDRAGSRVRPMRTLALTIGAVMLTLAAGAATGWAVVTVALLVAAVITVTTNGLAFTAVAEYAGRSWAGRALGIQNTGQNLLAAATPPALGALVSVSAYSTAFATVVVFPLVAALLIPGDAAVRPGAATPRRRPADRGRPERC